MSVSVTKIETEKMDGITRNWYHLKGTDYGTGRELDGEYAITSSGHVLDSDGAALIEGDYETIAVRNALHGIKQ